MYLRSGGSANSLNGDGMLSLQPPPAGEPADRYRYDPMNPVQTIGGGDCCNGGLVTAGAFDQRPIEARNDVLVYTSEALTEPMQVTGFIDAVLKVSSSATDTDFAVKLVDVAPDGTAYILGDTIMCWRDDRRPLADHPRRIRIQAAPGRTRAGAAGPPHAHPRRHA
jgi:putative CocE/NonD family hydrolase